MRWVTAHGQGLLINDKTDAAILRPIGFKESITARAIHELLFQPAQGSVLPFFPAALAAQAVVQSSRRLVWIDATGTFYPPAILSAGVSLQQLHVLRPAARDLVWATIETLRCKSIATVVALMTQPLTRVQARRLQLAAETGSGVGVLIRPNVRSAAVNIYAAATRWLVSPMPGERVVQRWRLEMVHGHGRQVGQSFILEKNRASGQTRFVHSSAPLVDQPTVAADFDKLSRVTA